LFDADKEGVGELPFRYEVLGKLAVDQVGLDLRNKGLETLVQLPDCC
jgi:hypothetical protein